MRRILFLLSVNLAKYNIGFIFAYLTISLIFWFNPFTIKGDGLFMLKGTFAVYFIFTFFSSLSDARYWSNYYIKFLDK